MKPIQTDRAPQAIGPYSQGIRAGNLLYTSGQIPLTANGKKIAGGIALQTQQVMENLKAVLEEGGASFNQVIKTTIFLKDMKDFATVNEIYGKWFPTHQPARSCVQVSQLPKGADVEIEAIAIVE